MIDCERLASTSKWTKRPLVENVTLRLGREELNQWQVKLPLLPNPEQYFEQYSAPGINSSTINCISYVNTKFGRQKKRDKSKISYGHLMRTSSDELSSLTHCNLYLINVCGGNTELEGWVAQIKWTTLLKCTHCNNTYY